MPTASDLKKKLLKELPVNLAHIQKTIYPSIDELREWIKKDTIDVEVKSVSRYHGDIGTYDIFHYVDGSLHGMPDAALLDQSTRGRVAELLYTIPVYGYHPNNLRTYYISAFGKMFAQTLIVGWKDYAELVARLAFKYINTVLHRGIGLGRLGWFMLLLAEDWLKPIKVDLMTDYREVEVKSLNPVWDKALQHWHSTDLVAFDRLVSEMADYHLSQTEDFKDKSGDDVIDAEFSSRTLWIYPIEILAILRLREWHGLVNPPLSHPLFSTTPLARLYPSTQWPQDDLMDAAEKRFRSIYPDTPSLADLPKLRAEQQ